jgi:CMP-N-acetylneuraminic acid synthetase
MKNKNINDICVVVQARMGSQRVPGKMLRPFSDTTLVDILFNKLAQSKIIPKSNIYFSVYENELKDVGEQHGVNIFDRSKESAFAETDMKLIYEWYDKLPFKYVVLISACNPLLTIDTIDGFIKAFIESDKGGAFAVFEKKTYYWDKNGDPITDWKGASIMNTKLVEPIYEAAHCLYASELSIIKDGFWMDINYPPKPELYVMKELEAFDIDYEWQFQLGEQLYKMDIC